MIEFRSECVRVGDDSQLKMDQNWHGSMEFNKLVLDYHDKFARQPPIAEAKAELQQLKKEIKQQMETQGLFRCVDFVYKGSTYEGVKILRSQDDCPEFDLDFIIRGGEYLQAEIPDEFDSLYRLEVRKSNDLEILKKAQTNGMISSSKVMQLFYGSLSKCEFQKTYNVVQRYHGPAVQLDVHHPGTNELWFQVDLAPAFYLEGQNQFERFSECFIAKILDESFCYFWYKSHAIEEKRLLDRAGGQRKVVLRTLKAMRGHSTQLSGLQSYHMKTALFKTMDDFPHDYEWTIFETGQRLINALQYLCCCLENGIMPNHFNKAENILKLRSDARVNLKNRIVRLIVCEGRMYSVISNPLPPVICPIENPCEPELPLRNASDSSYGLLIGLGLGLTVTSLAAFGAWSLYKSTQTGHNDKGSCDDTSENEQCNKKK